MTQRPAFVDISLSLENTTLRALREMQSQFSDKWIKQVRHFKLPFLRYHFDSNQTKDLINEQGIDRLVMQELATLSSPHDSEKHVVFKKISFIQKSQCTLVVVEVQPSQQIRNMRDVLMNRLIFDTCEQGATTTAHRNQSNNRQWNPYIVLGTVPNQDLKPGRVNGLINGIIIQHSENTKSATIYLPSPGDVSVLSKTKIH